MTKEFQMTNDEFALIATFRPSPFAIRHSFVIGYFVIRH